MKHNLETLKKNFTKEELAEVEKELREALKTEINAHARYHIKGILGELGQW
jgi:hypothetical protein